MQFRESEKLYEKSLSLAPAGVHSPVRAFKAVGGAPVFFKQGKGSQITDVDNNTYVDFCMCWGALAVGHAHPTVVTALTEQAARGTHYGTPTPLDVQLGELVLSALKPFDQIRFVNSGTEAVMTALRLARGYTGKNKIVKIDGCYHGHVDSLLVSAGSGLMTQGLSSSKGVPQGTVNDTLVVPFESKEALIEVFKTHGHDIAAIIIEPVLANSGLFEPSASYLEFLRKITRDHESLLIYDEVITGFRVAWGGAKYLHQMEPDIGTYGKIIGGGLPVGAICARKEIMDTLAPVGGVYQAGTLSGNPLCMTAGIATLQTIQKNNFYDLVENKLGPYLDEAIAKLKTKIKYPLHYARKGAIFWLCPGQEETPAGPSTISPSAPAKYKEVYRKILSQGVYVSPSVYEVGFLSLAHTTDDIDALVGALGNL